MYKALVRGCGSTVWGLAKWLLAIGPVELGRLSRAQLVEAHLSPKSLESSFLRIKIKTTLERCGGGGGRWVLGYREVRYGGGLGHGGVLGYTGVNR